MNAAISVGSIIFISFVPIPTQPHYNYNKYQGTFYFLVFCRLTKQESMDLMRQTHKRAK